MPYNRISKPKFFIDAALLARQWGMINYAIDPEFYTQIHYDTFFNLNPSNVTNVERSNLANTYRAVNFKNRYFINSITHCFILGHNLYSDNNEVMIRIQDDGGGQVGANIQEKTTVDSNGWTKFDFGNPRSEVDAKNIAIWFYNTYEGADSISIPIGDVSFGWSYTMPHSPDLELTQSFSNESIKTQTTTGGHTLTNAGWNQKAGWIRPAWSTGHNSTSTFNNDNFKVFPSGRRSWNLKFSYVSDTDLFPEASHDTYGIFENIGTIPNGDESGFMFSIKSDFMSKVYNSTNGFQLPFIFSPNSDADNPQYAICRINNDTATFNQVANNVYDISLDIVEVW